MLFGVDKFSNVMAEWSDYLWTGVTSLLPVSPDGFMLAVGVIEIAVGLLVARPRLGGYVVAAGLGGIILNLLLAGGFWDIVLRDFGLLLGALALARLATAFAHQPSSAAGS